MIDGVLCGRIERLMPFGLSRGGVVTELYDLIDYINNKSTKFNKSNNSLIKGKALYLASSMTNNGNIRFIGGKKEIFRLIDSVLNSETSVFIKSLSNLPLHRRVEDFNYYFVN